MGIPFRRVAAITSAIALALPGSLFAQEGQVSTGQDSGYVLRSESDLVLTNVVVRDSKTGEPVLGLKPSDFTILENGKPEKIASFDFESVDMAKPLNEATISGLAASTRSSPGTVGMS